MNRVSSRHARRRQRRWFCPQVFRVSSEALLASFRLRMKVISASRYFPQPRPRRSPSLRVICAVEHFPRPLGLHSGRPPPPCRDKYPLCPSVSCTHRSPSQHTHTQRHLSYPVPLDFKAPTEHAKCSRRPQNI